MAKNPHSLLPRDRAILEFVARYRLATDALLHRQFFPEVQDHGPVRKVTSRLVLQNYLREFQVAGRLSYYALAPRGCRALGLPGREPRPFTEQSLPAALAIAYFCVANRVKLFTAAEFRERFPEMCRPSLKAAGYYVEEVEGRMFLRLLLVDRAAQAEHVVRKVLSKIAQRYKLKKFASLIQNRRFAVIVLTGFAAKQRELEAALRAKHKGPVAVRVEVVPEVGAFLTRR
ncbi:MAG: hypothetical protein K2X38_23075 [Gemmataceae bacterium]|nr:hypothetical protein [Gemmataceae bacterium]